MQHFLWYHAVVNPKNIHGHQKLLESTKTSFTAHCYWALFKVHGCETVPSNKFWGNAEYFVKNIISFPELLLSYDF